MNRKQQLQKQRFGTLQATKEFTKFKEDFVYSQSKNMTSEVEYMLKKSIEDDESPLCYDDVPHTSFDIDEARLELEREFIDDDERNAASKVLLKKGLDECEDKEELEDFAIDNLLDSDMNQYERDVEVYQWFLMDDRLLYQLEEKEEVILNNEYWGRQCCGQAIEMDSVIIQIFKEWFLNLSWIEKEFNLLNELIEVKHDN